MTHRSPPRPRLLFLCQTLPYPPDGGVLIRSYNVLRLLARDFDVTALCFYRVASQRHADQVRQSVEALSRLARIEVFPIPQEHSRARLLHDHLRSILTRTAYTVFAYESAPLRQRLAQLLAEEQFDLVHLDSLDLAGYLPMLDGIPTVVVHHNVESHLLRRRAATSSIPSRWYMRLQSILTRRQEAAWCPRVALNVVVSRPDEEELSALAPTGRYVIVPNGVDTRLMKAQGEVAADSNEIVFVGGYTWQPNRDAMDYFCAEVLPLLRSRGLQPRVTWVGRAPPAVQRHYAERHGVTMTGYVDDIRPIVARAACYVAPLRAGGGTRLKILDAWSLGKAVVSTTVGCEGLESRDGDNILVRDQAHTFAEAVQEILEDPCLRDRLGRAARRTAEQTYDWEVIARGMLGHYHDAMDTAGLPVSVR